MFQTNVAEKTIHIFYVQRLFPEKHSVYEIIMEQYGKSGQFTDDNIIWRMRIACWVTKATDPPSEYFANAF